MRGSRPRLEMEGATDDFGDHGGGGVEHVLIGRGALCGRSPDVHPAVPVAKSQAQYSNGRLTSPSGRTVRGKARAILDHADATNGPIPREITVVKCSVWFKAQENHYGIRR